jgi:hypothetical protein
VEGRTQAQAIATYEGKSDRRKGGVELVTVEGSDVTKVKIEGGPIREELDWGILPCETLQGRVTEPGIQDPESCRLLQHIS